MPFQSEKQRRYLWANRPDIARKWENKYATGGNVMNDGMLRNNDITFTMKSDGGETMTYKSPKGMMPNIGILGGLVGGPDRGPTADNVQARLTPGEFVVNRPAAMKYGGMLEAINNEGRMMLHSAGYAGGGMVGYQTGGSVATYTDENGTTYVIKDGQLINPRTGGVDVIATYKWKQAGSPVDQTPQSTNPGLANQPPSGDPYRPVDRGRSGQVGVAPYEALAQLPERLSPNTNAPESELMRYYKKVVDEGSGTWFWQKDPQKVREAQFQQNVEYTDLDNATINQAGQWSPEMLRGLDAGKMAEMLRNPNLPEWMRSQLESQYQQHQDLQLKQANRLGGGGDDLGHFDPTRQAGLYADRRIAEGIAAGERDVAADLTDREDLGTVGATNLAQSVTLPGTVGSATSFQYGPGSRTPVTSKEEASRLVARGVVAKGAIFVLPNGVEGVAQ